MHARLSHHEFESIKSLRECVEYEQSKEKVKHIAVNLDKRRKLIVHNQFIPFIQIVVHTKREE